jgi:hypothetical protein
MLTYLDMTVPTTPNPTIADYIDTIGSRGLRQKAHDVLNGHTFFLVYVHADDGTLGHVYGTGRALTDWLHRHGIPIKRNLVVFLIDSRIGEVTRVTPYHTLVRTH